MSVTDRKPTAPGSDPDPRVPFPACGTIYPPAVYTVSNDLELNRNYSARLYLDHMLNGLEEEYRIRFPNGRLDYDFFSPVKVTSPSAEDPNIVYNRGEACFEDTAEIPLLLNGALSGERFSVRHRSVLNSVSGKVTPRILCIGDSITWGEGAVTPECPGDNRVYWLKCLELLKQDQIDSGGSGYGALFLGKAVRRSRRFVYKSNECEVSGNCEGYRGWSFSTFYSEHSPFYDAGTGKFSVNKWLAAYRTMDDSGKRLSVGAGTGSGIDESNVNEIDVCAPTVVTIMLGANGGGTAEQFKKLVSDIREEYPAVPIGLMVSDSAGTFFPSEHPAASRELTYWNNTARDQGDAGHRHGIMFRTMKAILDAFGGDEAERDNIFILPFYFVQQTAESGEMRSVPEPAAEFPFMRAQSELYTRFGWCPTTHVNAAAHANFAYQLYAWLKYLEVNALIPDEGRR
ncbi:MAG: hypothetical protein E7576_00200 [Ruminococcaceae bacterium]|nr:hypothetical protein [Oscillospiraceae bacterium]